ncbi:oleosin S1-2-like [Argentina anserina]|uniref:oleosin S1-2-like n=1 Tax=Argentina anserina TaxID=57926 RepID=UPI002176314C|nr:oleosin S1-2-like [Potentilla anserina]
MESRHQQQGLGEGLVQGRHEQQASGTMVAVASITGLAIGGSLLGLMGLSFLASLTLLLFSSPLLLIFSPLLLFGAFVFVGSLAGFAAAAAMALIGMSALGWLYQEVGGQRLLDFGGGDMTSGVKEQGKGLGRYI